MKKMVVLLFVSLMLSLSFVSAVYTYRFQAEPTADRWYEIHTKGYSSYPNDIIFTASGQYYDRGYHYDKDVVYERIVSYDNRYGHNNGKVRIIYTKGYRDQYKLNW